MGRASPRRRGRWRANRRATLLRRGASRSRSRAPPHARMKRIEAEVIDELDRLVDIPDGEVAPFAGLERADLVEATERACRFAGESRDAFLERQAEECRRHVHGE